MDVPLTQTGHFHAMLDAKAAARRAMPRSSWWADLQASRDAFAAAARERQETMRHSALARKVHTDWDGVQGGAGFAR